MWSKPFSTNKHFAHVWITHLSILSMSFFFSKYLEHVNNLDLDGVFFPIYITKFVLRPFGNGVFYFGFFSCVIHLLNFHDKFWHFLCQMNSVEIPPESIFAERETRRPLSPFQILISLKSMISCLEIQPCNYWTCPCPWCYGGFHFHVIGLAASEQNIWFEF